jgi:hypothetical protein
MLSLQNAEYEASLAIDRAKRVKHEENERKERWKREDEKAYSKIKEQIQTLTTLTAAEMRILRLARFGEALNGDEVRRLATMEQRARQPVNECERKNMACPLEVRILNTLVLVDCASEHFLDGRNVIYVLDNVLPVTDVHAWEDANSVTKLT